MTVDINMGRELVVPMPAQTNEFVVLTRVDGTPVAVRRDAVVAFVDATTHERPAVAVYVYGKDDPIVVRRTFAQCCRMFGVPCPPKPERVDREDSAGETDWRSARGAAPGFLGGERSEDVIRRLRDDDAR